MLERNHPRARARKRWSKRRGGFTPASISAVSAWLRLPQGTITGAGYSSVPDVLNASNPATQSTDASRPPRLLSANGQPTADFDGSADHLSWPAASNNNQTVTTGFAAWVEFDSVPASQWGIFCGVPGATNRLEVTEFNGSILIDVHISQFSARRGSRPSVFAAATKYFLTFEYDGAQAVESDKCIVTINGAVQGLTFSDSAGAPGAMPATLVSTAGPFFIGARTAVLGFMDGKIGPNIYVLGSKMAGATTGLLTAAARTFLMNFEAPVPVFNDVAIPQTTGWLRLASSSQSGGEWTPSIVDVLNPASPMTQTDVDRRAAVGATANGLPTMVFDGTDVHLWPQSPGHSSTTKVGIWMWFKPAANGGGIQWLYSVLNGTGGSTTNRFRVGFFLGRVYAEVYTTNTDGRSLTSASTPLPAAGVWYSIYIQYDSSRGGDANMAIFVNGTSIPLTGAVVAGAGSALGALQAASGAAIVGGFSDSDTPTQPITNGGELGPNFFSFNDNLSAGQIAALQAYELPT